MRSEGYYSCPVCVCVCVCLSVCLSVYYPYSGKLDVTKKPFPTKMLWQHLAIAKLLGLPWYPTERE